MKNILKLMPAIIICFVISGCQISDELINDPIDDNNDITLASNLKTNTPKPTTGNPEIIFDECIDTFQSFAYTVPEEDMKQIVMPLSPWEYVTDLPPTNYGKNRMYPSTKILVDFWVDGIQEIWILSEEYMTIGNFSEIEIYYPEKDEWKIISPYVGGTTFYVNQLFVTPDGTIFGGVTWSPPGGEDGEESTVLTKYNAVTNEFEVIPELLDLAVKLPLSSLSETGLVLMDQVGDFWIFLNNDGLYHFDSTTFEITQMLTFSGMVIDGTISSDRSIFFILYAMDRFYFGLDADELFQFVPDTGELISLNPPLDEDWPSISSLLVDSQDRLWLGSVGWIDNEWNWNLLHPDFEGWTHVMTNPRWNPPRITYESSDGRLWFYKFTETWYEGTVWYDPQTGEGCWFTNENGVVYEDANQQLWLTVNSKLFKLDLSE